MDRKVIQTDLAPKAIGVYSQGIITGGLVYTSGQIPIDPRNGDLIKENFRSEVKQVLNNLDAVLTCGGSSLKSVIKFLVFLTDMSYFSEVNEVFQEYFNEDPPARSAVEVSALPMGARIEIEAIGMIE